MSRRFYITEDRLLDSRCVMNLYMDKPDLDQLDDGIWEGVDQEVLSVMFRPMTGFRTGCFRKPVAVRLVLESEWQAMIARLKSDYNVAKE